MKYRYITVKVLTNRDERMPETVLVEFRHQCTDAVVQLFQREEDLVAQPGQDPALNNLNANSHLWLVPGFSGRAGITAT